MAQEVDVDQRRRAAPGRARQVVGEARRRADDLGDEIEQARVRIEQREDLHAGRQAGQRICRSA